MKVCFIGKKDKNSSCRQILPIFHKKFNQKNILDVCLTQLSTYNTTEINRIKNFNPDFIFIIKGQQICKDVINFLSNYNIVYFFLDALHESRINIEKFLYIASKSKIVLTPSHQAVNIFKQVNQKSFEFLQAVGQVQIDNSKYIQPSKRKYDIFFAGSTSNHRNPFLQSLLNFKNNRYKVGIFGLSENNRIPTYNLSNIASDYKIIVNLLFDTKYNYISLRNFEMLGSYQFLLSEYCSNLAEIFKKEKHCDYFITPLEFEQKINFYLQNPQKMDEIALNGYLECINFHNWEVRMNQLIDFLKMEGIYK